LDNWTEPPLVPSVGFDDSAGNGRLTYTGARPVLANVMMNLSVESEKKALISLRVGINGAVGGAGSEISASAEHNHEVLALTTTAAAVIQPGDFISCFGRSDKNDDLTVVTAHISIVTSPI